MIKKETHRKEMKMRNKKVAIKSNKGKQHEKAAIKKSTCRNIRQQEKATRKGTSNKKKQHEKTLRKCNKF